MMTEQQQQQAIDYALGELGPAEEHDFTAQVRAQPELRAFLRSVQNTLDRLALTAPPATPSPALKQKVLARLSAGSLPKETPAGLRFLVGSDTGWKALPVAGAFIKLLSFEPNRGYAVLLGKLAPGVRYPAHTNAGPEDFYILTGDLHVGDRVLGPGDFHHADAGSLHRENYSVEGCTLLAVLTTDDPLVQLAMA